MAGVECNVPTAGVEINGKRISAGKYAAAVQLAGKLRREYHGGGGPRASRDDPKFVESFVKNSRLSFLGTYKARVEKLVR